MMKRRTWILLAVTLGMGGTLLVTRVIDRTAPDRSPSRVAVLPAQAQPEVQPPMPAAPEPIAMLVSAALPEREHNEALGDATAQAEPTLPEPDATKIWSVTVIRGDEVEVIHYADPHEKVDVP
jgi:hypothetical protein